MYIGSVICYGGICYPPVWVGDVGYVPANWEDAGQLPPQGGPQVDGVAAKEEDRRDRGIPPTGKGNGRGRHTGGGYLHCYPPEHGHTIDYYQAHYKPVSGGRATPRDKVVEAVV